MEKNPCHAAGGGSFELFRVVRVFCGLKIIQDGSRNE